MALTNVVVNNATAGNQSQPLLGHLVFASVGDLRIHKQDLEHIFTNAGLSLNKYQPGDIRPSDAMRRATSKLKNKKLAINYNGQTVSAILDVTEQSEAAVTIRHIGRKVVDEKGRKVCYDQLTSFLYDKQNQTLTFEPTDALFAVEYNYNDEFNTIVNLFNEWCQYHTRDTVRNIINKVINSLMPTPIKTSQDDDAVARFIPVRYQDDLHALKKVVADLKQYHTNNLTSGCQLIELYDSTANNAMISNAVQGDIKLRIQNVVNDLAETLKQRSNLPLETVQRYTKQLVQMRAEAIEYAGLLRTSMSILEAQISTALNRVEEASPIQNEGK